MEKNHGDNFVHSRCLLSCTTDVHACCGRLQSLTLWRKLLACTAQAQTCYRSVIKEKCKQTESKFRCGSGRKLLRLCVVVPMFLLQDS